jgi:DNA-binding transcriptional LysR family regulator
MASLQGLVAFAVAARNESFAAASRELSTTPSAVAKAVGRLEAQFGVRLFDRTTRKVSLTAEGRDLYERSRRIIEEIEALESAAVGARSAPQGTLRISVPLVYGRKVLLPVIARLALEHPRLSVDVRFSDAYADLVGGRIEAAVRVGRVKEEGFVARAFDHQQLVTVASPQYLARAGLPLAPADVMQHPVLRFRMPSSGRLRPLEYRVRGRLVSFDPPTRMIFDDGEAMIAGAAAGLGLAQAPDNMMQETLASGRVVEVLAKHRPPGMPISIVYANRRQVSPRLRVLVAALTRLHEAG